MDIIYHAGTAQTIQAGTPPADEADLYSLWLLYRNTTTAAVAATGSVTVTTQPADGDTVTISDGTHSVVFEFDNDASVAGSNTAVTIGANAAASAQALADAITASTVLFTPSVTTNVVSLTANTAGTAANVTITKTGSHLAVTGMSGGAAAVASTPTATVKADIVDADGLTLGTITLATPTLSGANGVWTVLEVVTVKTPRNFPLNIALAQSSPGYKIDLLSYFQRATGNV